MARALTQHYAASAPRTSLLTWIKTLAATWRSRQALARLSTEQLADIGVSRDEAEAEVRRAAWDVPAYWCK